MPRLLLAISLMLMLLAACAALGSDGTGGAGGSSGAPEPITKEITLGCSNNLNDFHVELPWKLTVAPHRIVSNEMFAADLSAVAVVNEATLDVGQTLVGFKRVELHGLQATVHVRGATREDGPDVVLNIDPNEQRTCRYDDAGVDAGPFPQCDQDNDNPDGSNSDCTGLGGMPDPENRCSVFVEVPTSSDCTEGGACDKLGRPTTEDQCSDNGFCVSGPVTVNLEGTLEGFRAAPSGSILFGWDDQSTGAQILEEGGCNDGTWQLPRADFDADLGPTAMRIRIADVIEVALECTMAVPSRFEDGVMSCDPLTSPTPDHRLIAFPIQER